MATFEEIEQGKISFLNANGIPKITAMVDMLLGKALHAEKLEDKLRITLKAGGALKVLDVYGERITTAKTFEDTRSITEAIYADFLAEPVEATARGMEQASIVLLDCID